MNDTQVRIECAKIAAQFFPQLRDGFPIQNVCDIVYNWVTQKSE